MRVLGIDEAGRGCVLGDLFVAGFVVDDVDPAALAAAGATDSKRLSPRRREAARAALSALGRPLFAPITVAQIDTGNLNELEERAVAQIILEAQPDRVVLDALGSPAAQPAVRARLLQAIRPLQPEILIEPKADQNHPVCGAASIFAKTERDRALAEIQAQVGPLGSGYPSDPKTRAFLVAHARTGAPWPAFVRTRWATVAALRPDQG